MSRSRLAAVALAAALAVGLTSLFAAAGAPAEPSKSQALFRRTLLGDARTTPAIKGLLRSGGGFVAPDILFTDLTGDGRSDAVVLIDSGGVAGAVALYVLSTDGAAQESPLRVVYRSQRLFRAAATTSGGALILRLPRFAKGDDVCCPKRVVERVFAWNDHARTLQLRSSRELDGPRG
ncbi:MAG: hypothetical protein M3296_02655 [Actinomycetota bacterium]|nr:hypothetical protein [Actinomycetota bacterium]